MPRSVKMKDLAVGRSLNADRSLPTDPSISDLARQHRDERLEKFEGHSDCGNVYLYWMRKAVKSGKANY